MTLEQLREYAVEQARTTLPVDEDEDFCVNDHAGGNIDDAYDMGVTAGNISAWRYLCDRMGWDFGK